MLTRKDNKKADAKGSTRASTTSGPSTGGFPSSVTADPSSAFPSSRSSDTSSSGDINESDARTVVERYLDDVNTQDRTDAATLICPELVDTWRTSIDKASGDFTVTVTSKTYQGATPASRGLDLKYSLNVKSVKTSQTGVSPVVFTVVKRSADLLICGEKGA